jgi:hypothetical protein
VVALVEIDLTSVQGVLVAVFVIGTTVLLLVSGGLTVLLGVAGLAAVLALVYAVGKLMWLRIRERVIDGGRSR